LLSNHA
jgi:dual specificity tyrosine-phosphorylation-regulated kinase 1